LVSKRQKKNLFGIDSYNIVSRFVDEIDSDYLDIDKDEEVIINNKKDINLNINYTQGEHISHITFGKGVIIKVEDQILTIAFPHPHGIKSIIKGHKSIRKVD
jgi:DNA helicase II / ATP-dependent DNA helicase PcrA